MLTDKKIEQLREVGFPMRDMRCSYCIDNKENSCAVCKNLIVEPTLSDLIGAVMGIQEETSFSLDFNGSLSLWSSSFLGLVGNGENEKEAVADLYLKVKREI